LKRLIADSGATKTDWCLIKGNEILKHYSGKGISPVFQTEDQISNEIHNNVFPEFKEWNISKIHFYGSGCIAENIPIVKSAIFKIFPIETIEVYSDLIAAAHSLCGHKPGIACILGTGSNSCEWDGNRIINQISPLGFILGDEGNGTHKVNTLFTKIILHDISFEKVIKAINYNLPDRLIIQMFTNKW
jgi:N-acetylglucosamine kinase-like BadF-type ATPase